MSAMQAFHNRLFSATGEPDSYWSGLRRLTQAVRQVQLAAVETVLSWGHWAE